MFSSPTAWGDLYGQSRPSRGAGADGAGADVTRDSHLHAPLPPSTTISNPSDASQIRSQHQRQQQPAAALDSGCGAAPQGPLFASSTRYTVASQPVRCFPQLPPLPPPAASSLLFPLSTVGEGFRDGPPSHYGGLSSSAPPFVQSAAVSYHSSNSNGKDGGGVGESWEPSAFGGYQNRSARGDTSRAGREVDSHSFFNPSYPSPMDFHQQQPPQHHQQPYYDCNHHHPSHPHPPGAASYPSTHPELPGVRLPPPSSSAYGYYPDGYGASTRLPHSGVAGDATHVSDLAQLDRSYLHDAADTGGHEPVYGGGNSSSSYRLSEGAGGAAYSTRVGGLQALPRVTDEGEAPGPQAPFHDALRDHPAGNRTGLDDSDYVTPARRPPLQTPSWPHQQAEGPSISDGAWHLTSVRHRSAAAAASALLLLSTPSASPGFGRKLRGDDGGSSGGRGCGGAGVGGGGYEDAAMDGYSTPYKRRRHDDSLQTPLSSGATNTPMTPAAAAAAASSPVSPVEPCCVAAVIFNNAKEVGVALCELPSLTISLLQFADTAVFFKSSTLLHCRNPVEVLVPSTVVDTEFVQTLLRQHGAHMTFTSVQRCFYNTEAGVQRLQQLKASEEATLCIEDTDRYLCVAAANALVLYMEHVNDMQLLPGSIRVRAEALEHFMEISRTTARALQVVADGGAAVGVLASVQSSDSATRGLSGGGAGRAAQHGVVVHHEQQQYVRRRGGHDSSSSSSGSNTSLVVASALVDVIPRACTVMGQRYLRRTLLQPLRDRVAVQGRHDAVEWLLTDPRRLHVLRALLRQTAALDLERLTATLTLRPRQARTEAQQQAHLESLLLLWSSLPVLERLHAQLSAYLGPPPSSVTASDGGDNTTQTPETHSPEEYGGREERPREERDAERAAAARQGSAQTPPTPLVSTPAYPAVLHSVATTLRRCQLEQLEALMSRHLERSVLPSVVENSGHGMDGPLSAWLAPDAFSASALAHTNEHARAVAAPMDGFPQHRGHPQERLSGARRGQKRQHQQQHTQQRSSTTTLLRVLRMCFLVQAPRGGELDALRTRLSQRIASITTYAEGLKQQYQLYSLRLEPDPVKLYCLSYLSSEAAKARAAPFTWRFAGGSHFALYLAALRQQQDLCADQQQHPSCTHAAGTRQQWPHTSSAGRAYQTLREGGESESGERSMVSGHPPPSDPVYTRYGAGNQNSSIHSMSSSSSSGLVAPPWSHPSMHRPSAHLSEQPSCGLSPLDEISGDGLPVPAAGTQTRRQRHRRVRCGTDDLDYRCARTQECVAAILEQQMRLVEPMVQTIRTHFLGALQATVESVALLDTLLSFALYSLTHHCTRPVLVELLTGRTTAPEMEQDTAQDTGADGTEGDVDDADSDSGGDGGGGGDRRRRGEAEQREEKASSPLASQPSLSPRSSVFSYSDPESCTALPASTMDSANTSSRPQSNIDGSSDASAASHGCPFFVRGAFHPSVGVPAAVPRGAPFPSSSSSSPLLLSRPSDASRVSCRAAVPEDGISLSWGADGFVSVVTGPNACGKTTLLRLLGQHITLAQAGCFVPARHCQLFLSDRLLAHMLCDELPSVTLSSFKRELMELNEVAHAATPESVVLMDELGRSTTTAQGFTLAWATALFLSERRVHAVMTTHFAGLPSLTRVLPGRVVAYHFRVAFGHVCGEERSEAGEAARCRRHIQVTQHSHLVPTAHTRDPAAGGSVSSSITPGASRRAIVRFVHTLFRGPCPQRWYGVALAERMHFFEPVLAMARRTRDCHAAVDDEEGVALQRSRRPPAEDR